MREPIMQLFYRAGHEPAMTIQHIKILVVDSSDLKLAITNCDEGFHTLTLLYVSGKKMYLCPLTRSDISCSVYRGLLCIFLPSDYVVVFYRD